MWRTGGGLRAAQPGDLLVLGGDAGQRKDLELGQVLERCVLAGDAVSEGVVLGLQASDLGVPGAGICCTIG